MCGIFGIITYDEHISNEEFDTKHNTIKHRGPDGFTEKKFNCGNINYRLGFYRLAIVGNDFLSNQPFVNDECIVMCNGEIYNYKQLITNYRLNCKSKSDCEVILHLYKKYGIKTLLSLIRGEYAIVIIDNKIQTMYLLRDQTGVRPLYYHNDKKKIVFSSEEKSDDKLDHILPEYLYMFKFGESTYTKYLIKKNNFPLARVIPSDDYNRIEIFMNDNISKLLVQAVERRLYTNKSVGFLLSGGLDSSLILGIAMYLYHAYPHKYKILYPINVFSIGLQDSKDVINAKTVVEHLMEQYGKYKIKHHIITYTLEEGINEIPETIKCLGSYDQTTIRASTPMRILTKYISKKTSIKVILSGEGSDELFGGYLYFHYAKSPQEFDKEVRYRLSKLYMYDNLRADRTVSYYGMELRVPFLDEDLMEFVLSLHPSIRVPPAQFKEYTKKGYNTKIEKYILRNAFNNKNYISQHILWAQKEAFSDGVGHSWKLGIKNWMLKQKIPKVTYEINPPKTPEEEYYRYVFEQYYPNRGYLIPEMWLPNKQWIDTKGESSATVLNVYQRKNIKSNL